MRHPGRSRQARPPKTTPEDARWLRFTNGYTGPFYAKHGFEGGPQGVGYLLEIIADEAFDETGGSLKTLIKAETFREFADHGHEIEDAEAALRFLEEEAMVEVHGNDIRVPARFWIDPTEA